MTGLNLAQARSIVGAALAHGEAEAMQPLAVLVLDTGGHAIAFERQDGASNLRF